MLNLKTANYLEGLYMIEHAKTKVVMSKPIYVGCTSLDLSNLTMLEFHYNVIERMSNNNYTVSYCDTDSFGYNI